MTAEPEDKLRSFIDEARHLTTNLNIFVSDMIRDRDLVRQLDHQPPDVRVAAAARAEEGGAAREIGEVGDRQAQTHAVAAVAKRCSTGTYSTS